MQPLPESEVATYLNTTYYAVCRYVVIVSHNNGFFGSGQQHHALTKDMNLVVYAIRGKIRCTI